CRGLAGENLGLFFPFHHNPPGDERRIGLARRRGRGAVLADLNVEVDADPLEIALAILAFGSLEEPADVRNLAQHRNSLLAGAALRASRLVAASCGGKQGNTCQKQSAANSGE